MARSVYVGDTSSELAEVRRLLTDQIGSAGLLPVMLDARERQDDADLRGRVRSKMQAADAYIGVMAYRRGWEPAHLDGQSLAEVEYATAHELGKPVGILTPKPDSDLAQDLRQRAIGQNPMYREAQKAFLQRVEQESPVRRFADEAEFSEQVADLLDGWAAVDTGPARAEAAPPAGWWQRWWQRMIDVDRLAEQVAESVYRRLAALQQHDQMELAQQAMKYQEALRLKPGELVFGKPLTTSQFQSDVFVIMPFAAEYDPMYRGVIRPMVENRNLRCVRGDEFASSRGSIIEEVWAALNNCRLVIADITGGNDNVFYELGIAHTLNKPAIILTQADRPESVPFDIRHLRYVVYQNTDEGHVRLRADLDSSLAWLLADLEESWS
ncbi:MAG: DUF4062 domain-containing protein [Anaerolineae bacterium]|nr:DUF4062 domain-containing protein [Anaerolineae bacterium]